jgi:hypothetical protein
MATPEMTAEIHFFGHFLNVRKYFLNNCSCSVSIIKSFFIVVFKKYDNF